MPGQALQAATGTRNVTTTLSAGAAYAPTAAYAQCVFAWQQDSEGATWVSGEVVGLGVLLAGSGGSGTRTQWGAVLFAQGNWWLACTGLKCFSYVREKGIYSTGKPKAQAASRQFSLQLSIRRAWMPLRCAKAASVMPACPQLVMFSE